MCRPPAAPDETSGREQSNLRTLHGTFDSRRVDISLDPRRVASPASASRLMTYRFPFQTNGKFLPYPRPVFSGIGYSCGKMHREVQHLTSSMTSFSLTSPGRVIAVAVGGETQIVGEAAV